MGRIATALEFILYKINHCRRWQVTEKITLKGDTKNIKYYHLHLLHECVKCRLPKYEVLIEYHTGKPHTRRVSPQEYENFFMALILSQGATNTKETKQKIHVGEFTNRVSKPPEMVLNYLRRSKQMVGV